MIAAALPTITVIWRTVKGLRVKPQVAGGVLCGSEGNNDISFCRMPTPTILAASELKGSRVCGNHCFRVSSIRGSARSDSSHAVGKSA